MLHEKARLGLVTSLVAHPAGLTFNDLKALSALTDGNLNRHLKVLQDAALVEVEKGLLGKRFAKKSVQQPAGPALVGAGIDGVELRRAGVPEPGHLRHVVLFHSEIASLKEQRVRRALPPRDKVTGWWRLIALVQWLLMLLTLAGLVWIALILSLHGSHKSSSLISDTSLVPWLAVMVVALLLLGWLVESWCQNMVVLAADREREQANQAIMARIAAVTSDVVLAPAVSRADAQLRDDGPLG